MLLSRVMNIANKTFPAGKEIRKKPWYYYKKTWNIRESED